MFPFTMDALVWLPKGNNRDAFWTAEAVFSNTDGEPLEQYLRRPHTPPPGEEQSRLAMGGSYNDDDDDDDDPSPNDLMFDFESTKGVAVQSVDSSHFSRYSVTPFRKF
jgi:hypothetical protein